MSNKYIEKSFLFLLALSLLIHMGVLAFLYYLPEKKPAPPKEPVFIDLQQMPEPKFQKQQQEVARLSDQRIRVEQESAPWGTDLHDRTAPEPPRPPARPQPQVSPREAATAGRRETPSTGKPAMPLPADRRASQVAPGSSAASLLKPGRQQSLLQPAQPQLFPGAGKMAKLEESYRRKFENEIAEGDTRFLNTDDIQFGSFLRRFENSVYGVWRYPAEAARNGIEGITPVRITFSRNGEIMQVKLLESSGSRILDDEVIRTLKAIGPVGAFPKGYDKDEFNLIAFFQYGGARRALR
ncbi:MAG: TonB-dependent receptor [Desulfuromonadales bacterium GWD2_54_10]|nr:MAG: TonB-dependent receptor [Desulfuromonadales bacterium GWD2_54_10]